MTYTYGSVCSGIEAVSVAWEPLGMKPAWFAEFDKAPAAVLAHRFPHVENLGDMTAIPALLETGLIEAPEILVGGTPCQAFSVAGQRRGLADERGQLTLSYVEIANEIDRQRASSGREPCIAAWENVPGVLSQTDNAFGCFLAALAGDDQPMEPGERPDEGKSDRYWTWKKPKGETAKRHVPKWPVAGLVVGPERTVGWIVRDAQYYGLAQRRRRVLVVASARKGFDPGAILFEFDRVRRDSPPSRETGEGVASPTPDGPESSGGTYIPSSFGSYSSSSSSSTLRAAGGDYGGGTETLVAGTRSAGAVKTWPAEVAPTLNAHFGSKQGLEDQHALGGAGLFVPAQPATGFSSKDYGADATEELSPTLRASGHAESHANGGSPPAVAYAIQERAVAQNPSSGPDGVGVRSDDCAYTLEARAQVQAVCVTGSVTHTLKAEGFDASEDGTGRGQPITVCHGTMDPCVGEDIGFTLGRNNGGENVILAACPDVAGAICRDSFTGGAGGRPEGAAADHFVPTAYAFKAGQGAKANGIGWEEEVSPTITAGESGTQRAPAMLQGMAVRRLMPVECERLQGFPDNWTRIPVRLYKERKITKTRPEHLWERDPDGNGWWLMQADGPRYKQLGNSMAVPKMRWLGQRILWWLENREVITDLIA